MSTGSQAWQWCRKFWDIARTQGEKSGDRKQGIIQALIVDSQSGTNEAGVIVRALLVSRLPCPADSAAARIVQWAA